MLQFMGVFPVLGLARISKFEYHVYSAVCKKLLTKLGLELYIVSPTSTMVAKMVRGYRWTSTNGRYLRIPFVLYIFINK